MVGGTERYLFDLGDLLAKKGHEVAFFSTICKDNKTSRWNKYFIKKIDFKSANILNIFNIFPNMVYSFEAKRNVAKLLDEFRPDVVHLQNIYYYITPSIIREIVKRKIPIVQTVHDYQLISPNVVMFHNGKVCEITKINSYFKAVLHRCVKDSFVASLMATIVLYFQNIGHYYERSINLFITPSIFMKNKLIEYEINKNKIKQLNNFIQIPRVPLSRTGTGEYVLYFGRICEAKGITTLLSAAKNLSHIKFKIAGSFEDNKIESQILDRIKKESIKNIELLGYKNDSEIKTLISGSRFVVVPSIWYENQPYSILESFVMGKTVVASNIGGIPEIIENGKNGILFKAGDKNELIQAINKLWSNFKLTKELGQNAKKTIVDHFRPLTHYCELIEIYKKLAKMEE